MYYEEKMINGVMHYRSHPDDEFTPYTLEELSKRYDAAKEDAKRIRERGYMEGKAYEKQRMAELLGLGVLDEVA